MVNFRASVYLVPYFEFLDILAYFNEHMLKIRNVVVDFVKKCKLWKNRLLKMISVLLVNGGINRKSTNGK